MISLSTLILRAPSATAQILETSQQFTFVGRGEVYIHGIHSPQGKGKDSHPCKQLANPDPLGFRHAGAMQRDMPDDKEVRDAGDGVPPPLLGGTGGAKGGEQAAQDHNDVGGDGHQGVRAVDASEEAQVEEQEGRRQGPVDVAGPVDLAADLVEGVWDVLVGVPHGDAVVGDGLPRGEGEVRERGDDGRQGRCDVEDAFGDGHVP